MHVVATAGHVDHGKSTLVQALTGQDPDRLDAERRRGLTIELGYCWTRLQRSAAGSAEGTTEATAESAVEVAFVDVPGHERFVPTMLAGVGPVPAVLFVVAADDPWMPQAAEHLAALDALGVEHALLVATRSDLADPEPALRRARAQLSGTSLAGASAVAVSATTGEGMQTLRDRLVDLVDALPAPDPVADVRLSVDRVFALSGAGTVVTGTLPAGQIAVGDTLAHGQDLVRVRGLQTLGREVSQVVGAARVALRLGSSVPPSLARGSLLVTPQAWWPTRQFDVRVHGVSDGRVPRELRMHYGAGSYPAAYRRLGGDIARLTLDEDLPLRVGDRGLLRDPGSRRVFGVHVLDPDPPALIRRGAAARRAVQLASPDSATPAAELRRRQMAQVSHLRRLGVDLSVEPADAVRRGDWVVDAAHADRLRDQLAHELDKRARENPLDPGLPLGAAARALGLPTPDLVGSLVTAPVRLSDGRVQQPSARLPAPVERALSTLARDLAPAPFQAPDAARLSELGLDPRALAAAAKAGRLLRLDETVVLLPGSDEIAVRRLKLLPQPFTVSEARRQLGTSRRVVLPLLAHLDRRGRTRRLPDDRRTTT